MGRDTLISCCLQSAVATRAGIDPGDYEAVVVVDDRIEDAIVDAVSGFDTVCVGLSKQSDVFGLEYGTIAERASQETSSTVAIARERADASDPSDDRPPG